MSYLPNANISATGSATPSVAALIGGTDGTDLRAIAVNSSGQLTVLPAATTSGGLGLPFSASVTTAVGVKPSSGTTSSAGNIYGWSVLNNTAAIAYVQVFNKAVGNVTLGSTAPDWVIPVPANGTTGAGSNYTLDIPISHSTGITIACTTTRTGSTTAACDVLFFYN